MCVFAACYFMISKRISDLEKEIRASKDIKLEIDGEKIFNIAKKQDEIHLSKSQKCSPFETMNQSLRESIDEINNSERIENNSRHLIGNWHNRT